MKMQSLQLFVTHICVQIFWFHNRVTSGGS